MAQLNCDAHFRHVYWTLRVMKSLITLLGLTIVIPTFSQRFDLTIDSVVSVEIGKLKNRNVTEIGYTKLTCVNYGIRATAYLFWIENNRTYIQKIKDSEYDKQNPRRYHPIAFIDSVFFPFYLENFDSLVLENAKPFQAKPGQTTSTSHSCFRHFRVRTDKRTFDKYFDFFDLREFNSDQIDNSKLSKQRIEELRQRGWEVDTLYRNSPERNVNYQTNSELKIVKWDKVISKFIATLESTNPFVEMKE
jgi:hypothetical protein